ncbi:MAG: class I SAM-dependent methyltransferase [Lachnospiraceae bacterium]|nr:class I SAM-dependent methyltransferase [Lachnospiraceae bacterium]
MYKNFENKLDEIYRRLNGKKIIIWGWQRQGKILYLWLKSKNRKVEQIIDNNRATIETGRLKNYQILEYYDPAEIMILVTPSRNIDGIEQEISRYGYSGKNLIYIRPYFYGDEERLVDYYSYLDFSKGVDIAPVKSMDEQSYGIADKSEFHNYSPNVGMMLEYTLSMFKFTDQDAAFDFGCGKGGALTLFHKNGVGKIGGIEYDQELFEIAKNNMKKLNLPCQLLHGDAAECRDIDDYNIFYMFDPFVGDTFDRVIHNISESHERNKRKITIIYSAARCHSIIIDYAKFKLTYQIDNPFVFNGYTNIYICE